jgi:hypothetical protein
MSNARNSLIIKFRAELESLTVALEAVPKVSIYTDFRVFIHPFLISGILLNCVKDCVKPGRLYGSRL